MIKFKKVCLLLITFVNSFLSAQKKMDIIPNNNLSLAVGLFNLKSTHEYKLNERITAFSTAGIGVSYANGSKGLFTGERYSVFSFQPFLASELRYYLTLQNTNSKKKINKQFGGTYFGLGAGLTFNSINPQIYIDPRGGYGLGISIGKQVLKNSGWSFNYSVDYSFFSKLFDGENRSGGFGFGFSVGKTLFSN